MLMSSAKAKFYVYFQIVPLLAFVAFAWLAYTARKRIETGQGDAMLLGDVLLLMPLAYLILPIFFLMNVYFLWQAIRAKKFQQVAVVATGLLLIAGSYLIIYSVS